MAKSVYAVDLKIDLFGLRVRVPLEALLETARDGGFPLFSNGFGIIAIHCDSTLFHGGLWKNVGNV